MYTDPVGTTTASMVARLPADEDELLAYWGSLGSPCVNVFLPYYIDGEIPPILARGGEHPTGYWSPDSRFLSRTSPLPSARLRPSLHGFLPSGLHRL